MSAELGENLFEKAKIKTLVTLVEKNKITIEDACEEANMSKEEFTKTMDSMATPVVDVKLIKQYAQERNISEEEALLSFVLNDKLANRSYGITGVLANEIPLNQNPLIQILQQIPKREFDTTDILNKLIDDKDLLLRLTEQFLRNHHYKNGYLTPNFPNLRKCGAYYNMDIEKYPYAREIMDLFIGSMSINGLIKTSAQDLSTILNIPEKLIKRTMIYLINSGFVATYKLQAGSHRVIYQVNPFISAYSDNDIPNDISTIGSFLKLSLEESWNCFMELCNHPRFDVFTHYFNDNKAIETGYEKEDLEDIDDLLISYNELVCFKETDSAGDSN